MDMHAALVGKGAGPDERLARPIRHVGGLVDKPRQFGQVGHAAGATASVGKHGEVGQFEGEIGRD